MRSLCGQDIYNQLLKAVERRKYAFSANGVAGNLIGGPWDRYVRGGGMFCCLGLGVGRVSVIHLLLIFCVSLVRNSM